MEIPAFKIGLCPKFVIVCSLIISSVKSSVLRIVALRLSCRYLITSSLGNVLYLFPPSVEKIAKLEFFLVISFSILFGLFSFDP